MKTNLLQDPEIRRWQRARATTALAALCLILAGITFVGATSPAVTARLAVNCATEGLAAGPFDDSGAHAALCAGQSPPNRRGTDVADNRMPAPDAAAIAEPLPPTF